MLEHYTAAAYRYADFDAFWGDIAGDIYVWDATQAEACTAWDAGRFGLAGNYVACRAEDGTPIDAHNNLSVSWHDGAWTISKRHGRIEPRKATSWFELDHEFANAVDAYNADRHV